MPSLACAVQRKRVWHGKLTLFYRQGSWVKQLGADAYETLRAGAAVLEADSFGDKVLRLPDGTILKLFRRKRWFSSAAWYPYAQRFADNAAALRRLGVLAPEVLAVWRVPAIERDAVHYQPVPGRTLREMRRDGLEPAMEADLKDRFGQFLARLHDDGVYFRSLHLGNVVCTPDRQLALIDIADARFFGRPLHARLRERSLKRLHAFADESDWAPRARQGGSTG